MALKQILEDLYITSTKATGDTQTHSNSQRPSLSNPSLSGCIDLDLQNSQCQAVSKSVTTKISTNNETTGHTNSIEGKVMETAKISARTESALSSVSRISNSSRASDGNESSCSSFSTTTNKPHKSNDKRWESIHAVRLRDGLLGLSHLKLKKRVGCGDIGSVYLVELRGTSCQFAMKVMDKGSLMNRKKLQRSQTEKEILSLLDHPFLPTLYTHFETDKFSCLLMEYCVGGDLHILRQRQPGKHFTEQAARFYASEVLLALEYLHMLGVVYRDLKPENVLVREDGHIMLSDFDLSLQCAVSPTLVRSASVVEGSSRRVSAYCIQPSCARPASVQSSCIQPSCFVPQFLPCKSRKIKKVKNGISAQVTALPELVAEPTTARSMSFVGTHEYLAPEIIKGEGHGSAVDWWTFGIFLFELLHGKTPFKGSGNRATLFNVIGQPLKFPEASGVSFAARDLVRGLLVKDPQRRLASKRGATEIKQHPFFDGVNWALIRSSPPPEIPTPSELGFVESNSHSSISSCEKKAETFDPNTSSSYVEFDLF